jgi:hypothetical protein
MSVVLDASLTHLVESRENLEDVRDRYPPQEVKDCSTRRFSGFGIGRVSIVDGDEFVW